MASFTAGTTFVDGVSNDVTAAKLGNLVTNATPTSGFIQDRTAETVTATNDTLLIGDASDSNNLKRITVANFAQTLPTAKVTTGTIDTGTFGTTTSTAATITTLTAGTTTSTAATITTGTIPTLVATTLVTTGTGTAAAPAIVPTGDTNTGIFFPAADTVAFAEGGTEAMRIDSSGNVGIGTASPNSRLVVTSGTSPNRSQIIIGSAGLSENFYDSNTHYFRDGSQPASERMRIDSSGNVGIGTASPTTKLNVYDSSSASVLVQGDSVAQTITNRASADASAPILALRKSRGSVASPTAVASADALGVLNFQGFGGTNTRNLARISGNVETYVSDGDISANLAFLTSSTGGATPTEKMRIDSSGNVGIGNTSPTGKLDVVGGRSFFSAASEQYAVAARYVSTGGPVYFGAASASATPDAVISAAGGATLMTLQNGGNVGIGTTTPSATLHSVSASASTAAGIFQVTATSGTSLSAVSVIKQDALNTTNQNFVLFQVGGSTNCGKINANGANTAAFGSTSDSRLKENITALPSQINNICALRPCEFDYKDGSGHQIGFIAQEMQEVYPDAIGVGDDGMLTITAWSKTEARLVKAIQELKSENDSLKSRIEALESK